MSVPAAMRMQDIAKQYVTQIGIYSDPEMGCEEIGSLGELPSMRDMRSIGDSLVRIKKDPDITYMHMDADQEFQGPLKFVSNQLQNVHEDASTLFAPETYEDFLAHMNAIFSIFSIENVGAKLAQRESPAVVTESVDAPRDKSGQLVMVFE